MSSDEQAMQLTGEVRRVGLLDLTGMKSPEDLAGITKIIRVGTILVPESLTQALAKIPMERVGAVVPIPEGENVRVHTGQIKMSGEALAHPKNEEDVLVVVGQLMITSPVEKVGYKGLVVIGQVLAPKGSEDALGAGINRLTGQTIYYPENARFFIGEDRFGKAFFEFLEGPMAMVLIGEFTIEPDVPTDLLREKVSEITLMGELKASKEMVPLLQVLATEKYGEILVKG